MSEIKEAIKKELLPCPFCGGKAKTKYLCAVYIVACQNCHANGKAEPTAQKAVEFWNVRTEALEIYRLRSALANLVKTTPESDFAAYEKAFLEAKRLGK